MKPHSSRFRRVPLLMAAVAVAAIGGCSWISFRSGPESVVATSPVAVADIESTVIATGTLEASEMVSVGAQVSGQIESLQVKLGDRVRRGDPIAEIDATTQENTLRNARAALASARAQRSVQLATLRQAELAFERQKMMLAEEATSRADYETAEATLGSTRAQIEALDAQIEQSSASVDTAQANLGYTQIRAPMEGTVVAIVAKEGQTVNANQSTPTIVKLAKLDTMTVSAEISEADVVRVRPGQTVYFTILGNPDKRYYGTLRTIEPAPDSIESDTSSASSSSSSSGNSSNAVYYNGLFEVPNPDGELRISMTAQVFVVLGEAKDALTIPATALGERAQDGSYSVMVLYKQGKPAPRRITVGINNNVVVQVLSGLTAGERVVVGEAGAVTAAATQRRGPPPFM